MTNQHTTERVNPLDVACPACGAAAGEGCYRIGGRRRQTVLAAHPRRREAARR